MALNVDCQVTDETIVQLKRQNEELRHRLSSEIDAGHKLDRDVRAMEADLMHIEREEQSVALMIKESADVGHCHSGLQAHLAELRV